MNKFLVASLGLAVTMSGMSQAGWRDWFTLDYIKDASGKVNIQIPTVRMPVAEPKIVKIADCKNAQQVDATIKAAQALFADGSNVVAVEQVFNALGFEYAKFANTSLSNKKDFITNYLLVLSDNLGSMEFVKDFDKVVKVEFAVLSVDGNSVTTASHVTAAAKRIVVRLHDSYFTNRYATSIKWTKRAAYTAATIGALAALSAGPRTLPGGKVAFAWVTA